MKIKVEQISIADRIIDRIEDEEGNYWYPLKAFFLRVLCKREEVKEYRDSSLSRYMKVIKFKPYRSNTEVKTWCMSEQGIKFILKRLSIGKGKTEGINELRRKNLSEACLYFGIDRTDELQPKYIKMTPNLKDYDIWSVLCIENDISINNNTAWKKCVKCDYYYPSTKKYFATSNHIVSNICLQCDGRNFKCDNKAIQFLFKNNGRDLLFALHNNESDDKIVEKLHRFIGQGGYIHEDD